MNRLTGHHIPSEVDLYPVWWANLSHATLEVATTGFQRQQPEVQLVINIETITQHTNKITKPHIQKMDMYLGLCLSAHEQKHKKTIATRDGVLRGQKIVPKGHEFLK